MRKMAIVAACSTAAVAIAGMIFYCIHHDQPQTAAKDAELKFD